MCGIAGVVGRRNNPAIEPARFDRVIDSMQSRGPDDRGSFYSGRTALGARRLSIIDIEAGAQPIASEDGSVNVVLNGELYSHDELRRELQRAGHVFKTRSDTEVLVHSYEEWGIAGLLARVRGMFAFALHDARQDRVYIARDRMGIKPLLYYEAGDSFCFASSISSLLCTGQVPFEPDPVGIRLYLHNQFTPAPYTVLAGVRKLPPASYLCIQSGKPGLPISYWEIPHRVNGTNGKDWQEHLRTVLTESVHSHMVADTDVGVFLSGGLDSSIVLSLMAERGARTRVFSVAVKSGDVYDETPAAARCAARFNAELLPCTFTSDDFLDVVAGVIDGMEEPIGDPACVPTYVLSRHARQFVKVALSGEGADELFAGYGYYDRFTTVHGRVNHWLRSRQPEDSLPEHVWSVTPPRSRLSGYRRAFAGNVCDRLVRDLYCVEMTSHMQRRMDRKCATGLPRDSLNVALAADLDGWLPDDLLAKADRMSMAHGLEVRVPFLDDRVVELAFQMPPGLKRRASTGKMILRTTFASTLGADIAYYPKHGFNLPLRDWFRAELRPFLDEWLSQPWKATPWLDRRLVQQIVAGHQRGDVDCSRQIWVLFVLSSWFQSVAS